MNSVRSLSTSEASTLLSADKPLQSQNSRTDVAYNSRVWRVTNFVSNALGRLASSGMLLAILTSSRTRARPRRCKTRNCWPRWHRVLQAECVEGALWRSLILVVFYREEVGSFRALGSRLRPTWCTKSSPPLLPRH